MLHTNDPNPPPVHVLARRILSICANSASCERLFSVFGTNLTKLRNRMRTETLVSLAELKMHIRDEHRAQNAKARLKRKFGREGPNPVTEQPMTSATSFQAISDIASVDAHTPADPDDNATTNHTVAADLREMAHSFTQMVSNDEDAEPVRFPSKISISIIELFDFTMSSWVERYERNAHRSLEDELEFYELIDLDAEGEEDDTNFSSIDETLETILDT